MEGADVEIGMPLFGYAWLRGYAGTYYYHADQGDDPFGFRGRLVTEITRDAQAEIAVTHDDKFGARVTVGVQLAFAGRGETEFFPTRTTLNRRFDQVARNYRVATNLLTRPVESLAVNPVTNLPYLCDPCR